MAAGRPSKFPRLPALVHPLVRALLFRRVWRNGTFPKARTNKAMKPASGPGNAIEGRARLEAAHGKFAAACRQAASRDERMRTTIFGVVPVLDYVRFTELHTRHHDKQMAAR
jgi:hypothetical protein